jgi:hypothetical protein
MARHHFSECVVLQSLRVPERSSVLSQRLEWIDAGVAQRGNPRGPGKELTMNIETATTNETTERTAKRRGRPRRRKTAKAAAKAKAKTKGTSTSKQKSKPAGDSKKAIVVELLRRKEGTTTAEIAKATDWQNHTIRGFINPSF